MDDSKKIIEFLKDISKKLERIDNSLSTSKKEKPLPKLEKSSKRPQSLTALIIELKEDGFFDKPKTVKEITEKLEEQGWHYPRSSLTHPLQRLLRKRAIGRVGLKGKWAYVKR